VRELNDEINKHMRQKHYWEIRIRELGGSDYRGGKKQFYDVEGKELPGAPHYKYYGVAKVIDLKILYALHFRIIIFNFSFHSTGFARCT
jgi:hypothetical protein